MSTTRLDVLAPALLDALVATRASADEVIRRGRVVLARADLTIADEPGYEQALLVRCGLAVPSGAGLPLAGLTAAYDFDLALAPADSLRADPICLRADPSRVILFDADTVGITGDEADSLIGELNLAFGAHGVTFSRGRAPARWYVRLSQAQDVRLPSPTALKGRAVEDSLGMLRRSGELNRLLTEVQMVLHGAAVNEARAARGQPPLNSVWFWGAGSPPRRESAPPELIIGDDDLGAACARHLGIAFERDVAALPDVLAGGAHAAILVLAPTTGTALPDFFANILQPAWTALRRGRLARIDIHTRAAALSLTAAARWRPWRRVSVLLRQVEALLAAASS